MEMRTQKNRAAEFWGVEFFFILSGFLMAYTWKDAAYNEILHNAAGIQRKRK